MHKIGLAVVSALFFASACGSSNKPVEASVNRPGDAAVSTSDDAGTIPLPSGCEPVDLTYAAFAQPFFAKRCATCHAERLVGDARLGAPVDVDFDDEQAIAYRQTRIRVRAVVDHTMPPGAPLSDCDTARLSNYLATLGTEGACTPACDAKQCGDDGCGGSCGACSVGQACAASGACVDADCAPKCEGVACGDDGCGGSCGMCGPGFSCGADKQCVCAPACTGKACGDDGCGGSCGTCTGGDVCGLDGACLCIPSCDALVCGDDGCGGVCGTCSGSATCTSGTSCTACVPNCTGKCGGDDGCGGSCVVTACGTGQHCNFTTGKCARPLMCVGTKCAAGDECGFTECGACGAMQGACAGDTICNASRKCVCTPNCEGKACGDDGCGGSCGSCGGGLACSAGQCGCTGDCGGRECGSDGCGGTCGANAGACADGLSCNAGMCVALCVPSCSGKSCGDDGCGGSCGACGSGQSCDAGACVSMPVTFDSVFAIFQKKDCAGAGCHGGAKPAQSLNLSTASTAQTELINVTSQQCATKKLVAPGDPTQSYLVNKLTGVGMCSGSQMPKGGSALTNTELDTVRTWISGL